jgi:hypothetical protein
MVRNNTTDENCTRDDSLAEHKTSIKVEGSEISFTEDSVPGFMIEGLIGQAITQVFQQLTYFNELYTDKDHEKHSDWLVNGKALCLIAYAEAEQVLDCMSPMKDATLRPAHRAFRKITTEFIKDQRKLEKKTALAKRRNNKSFVSSINNIARWLTSTTVVMSSYSKPKDIQLEVWSWES